MPDERKAENIWKDGGMRILFFYSFLAFCQRKRKRKGKRVNKEKKRLLVFTISSSGRRIYGQIKQGMETDSYIRDLWSVYLKWYFSKCSFFRLEISRKNNFQRSRVHQMLRFLDFRKLFGRMFEGCNGFYFFLISLDF